MNELGLTNKAKTLAAHTQRCREKCKMPVKQIKNSTLFGEIQTFKNSHRIPNTAPILISTGVHMGISIPCTAQTADLQNTVN